MEDSIGHRKRPISNELGSESAKRTSFQASHRERGGDSTYCDVCRRDFSRPYVLRRHMSTVHGTSLSFVCDLEDCGDFFTRKDTLDRHKETQHGFGKVDCPNCGRRVRKDGLGEHLKTKICHLNAATNDASDCLPTVLGSSGDAPELESTSGVDEASEERDAEGLRQVVDPLLPWIFPSSGESDTIEMSNSELHGRSLINVEQSTNYPESTNLHAGIPTTTHPSIVPGSPSVSFGSSNPILYLREAQSEDESHGDMRQRQSLVAMNVANISTENSTAKLEPRSVEKSDQMATPSQWLFKPDGRFVQDLGSTCALCPQKLGPSYDSLYEHVKRHLRGCSQPILDCFECGVRFAFERDLMLHKKPSEMTNFSRELPIIQPHDNQDWIARASEQDRQTFIDGLRQWERFQMHCYLATIQYAFVQSKVTPSRAVQSTYERVSKPRIGTYTKTRSHIQCRTTYLGISNKKHVKPPIKTPELLVMFNQASLEDAVRKRIASEASKVPRPRLLLHTLSLNRNMSIHNAVALGDTALVEKTLDHFCIEDDYSSHSWQLAFIDSCHRGYAAIASALLTVRSRSRRLVRYACAKAFCKVLAAGLHGIFRDMLELRPHEKYDNSQIEEALRRFGVCPWACTMTYVSPGFAYVSEHFCKIPGAHA